MKKILLTTVVCLGLGLVASAQEKSPSQNLRVKQKSAESVSPSNAAKTAPAKTDPNDALAERTAAKMKYLDAMKAAEKKGSNLSKDSKPK